MPVEGRVVAPRVFPRCGTLIMACGAKLSIFALRAWDVAETPDFTYSIVLGPRSAPWQGRRSEWFFPFRRGSSASYAHEYRGAIICERLFPIGLKNNTGTAARHSDSHRFFFIGAFATRRFIVSGQNRKHFVNLGTNPPTLKFYWAAGGVILIRDSDGVRRRCRGRDS